MLLIKLKPTQPKRTQTRNKTHKTIQNTPSAPPLVFRKSDNIQNLNRELPESPLERYTRKEPALPRHITSSFSLTKQEAIRLLVLCQAHNI